MEPGDGWYRHLTNPCVGAIEFEFETTDIDAAGRVQRRTVAGRTYDYQQDAMGRLTAYTDYQNASNSATYSYDYRSRRVAMTVGGITTRFVYDGDDVVAEFVDEDADNQPDRIRYYWNLPGIDQRIGFVDVDVDTGAASYYYYLTDQIGSVIAVVNADGDIVNRYDYDAFGNLRRGTSWETVPNRYRFQGREYDAHRGDYYFRLRTYVPEWGMFSGPDFKIDPSDPNGACNYLFASNNPLMFRDPTGLDEVTVTLLVRQSVPGSKTTYRIVYKRGMFDMETGHVWIEVVSKDDPAKRLCKGIYPTKPYNIGMGSPSEWEVVDDTSRQKKPEKQAHVTMTWTVDSKLSWDEIKKLLREVKKGKHYIQDYSCGYWALEKIQAIGVKLPSDDFGKVKTKNYGDIVYPGGLGEQMVTELGATRSQEAQNVVKKAKRRRKKKEEAERFKATIVEDGQWQYMTH